MIILDVETTGTDPLKHSLVSIGALDFSSPDIRFYEECRIWEGAHIMPAALEVNGFSEEEITNPQKQSEGDAVKKFLSWLSDRESMVIAGQNVFFDAGFLRAAAARTGESAHLSHRIIDQHTLAFTHMLQKGITPVLINKKTSLDSDAIMTYVGIPVEPKPHIALNGALWEAEAFSRLLYDKNLLPEFATFPIPWKGN